MPIINGQLVEFLEGESEDDLAGETEQEDTSESPDRRKNRVTIAADNDISIVVISADVDSCDVIFLRN